MKNTLAQQAGDAVLRRREELGWAAEPVAAEAGLSPGGFARLEAGQGTDTDYLEMVARVLGCRWEVELVPF